MLNHGWKIAVGACCLLGMLAGCQMPPRSASAQGPGSNSAAGSLWSRLTGRGTGSALPEAVATDQTSARTPSQPDDGDGSQVRQVSATEFVTGQTASPASAAPPPATPAPQGPSIANEGTSISGKKKAALEDDEPKEFDWSDLAPENIYKNTKAALGYGPNEAIANSLYKEAEALYKEKQFPEAAKKFAAAAGRWPDSVLEEDAMFFEAESYFFADQYGKAHDAFMRLFKKYTNTRYLDVAAARQFSIGRYWEQAHTSQPHWPVTPNFTDKTRPWFDTFGNAISAYESVRLNDPTGPLADDAIMATANAYFLRGQYEDAAYHYDLLRKEYPKSKHLVEAHVLGLEAKRLVYQGPQYDGKPLSDADEIARQSLTQLRSQLGPEKARILQAREQITEQKAERDWAMARFYEKKKAYGAARVYYETMIKEHPGTQFAQMAEQRLAAIKDLPDNPPNHFKWLTGAFDKLK